MCMLKRACVIDLLKVRVTISYALKSKGIYVPSIKHLVIQIKEKLTVSVAMPSQHVLQT